MKRRIATCTQEGVTVSQPMVCSSVHHVWNTDEYVLHVSRYYPHLSNAMGGRGVFKKCDHNGKVFKSNDEAWAFALERGYLRPFYSPAQRARHLLCPAVYDRRIAA